MNIKLHLPDQNDPPEDVTYFTSEIVDFFSFSIIPAGFYALSSAGCFNRFFNRTYNTLYLICCMLDDGNDSRNTARRERNPLERTKGRVEKRGKSPGRIRNAGHGTEKSWLNLHVGKKTLDGQVLNPRNDHSSKWNRNKSRPTFFIFCPFRSGIFARTQVFYHIKYARRFGWRTNVAPFKFILNRTRV